MKRNMPRAAARTQARKSKGSRRALRRLGSVHFERLEDRCLLSVSPLILTSDTYARATLHTELRDPGSVRPFDPPRNFELPAGNRWTETATNGPGLGQGDPTTLTWSIVPDNTPIPGFAGETAAGSNLQAVLGTTYGSNAGPVQGQPWFQLFQQMFDRFTSISGVTYVFEPNDDGIALGPANRGQLGVRGDVRISGHNIDGNAGILAYNGFPNDTTFPSGDMVIDTADSFNLDTTNNSFDFRNTLAHEHGHGLGLMHTLPLDKTKLMEPFAPFPLAGPQHDDILGIQRGYGDAKEKGNGNNTFANATDLGTVTVGERKGIGRDGNLRQLALTNTDIVSIDDNSDVDFYRFTISTPTSVSIALNPAGFTYNVGPQFGAAPAPFNSRAQSDLSVALVGTNGTTILAESNTNGVGGSELIFNAPITVAGNYFVRVTGSADTVQLYSLDVAAGPQALVEGMKFNDGDNDGTFDASEQGLSGWTIFADANNNGTLDATEFSATTGTDGAYSLMVPAGTHTIAEVQQANWTQTFPDTGTYNITVAEGETLPDINFGNHTDLFIVTGTTTNGNALRDFILGPGVTPVGNATFVGSNVSAGFFAGGLGIIGIDSGILLSNGNATLAQGPNSEDGSSGIASGTGDVDLNAEFNLTTRDSTVLEFEFEIEEGDLFFNFVFASEEYNEFVNSQFNDVFAFFLDGQNIAVIPGTTTRISVNTINGGNPLGTNASNPQFYRNNDRTDGGSFLNTFGYDGFTTVFTALAPALAAGRHKIKLAISDVGDANLDTGVFIQAGSFAATPKVGRVKGELFNDLNGDGTRGDGEGGVAGKMVYVDVENNGIIDLTDPRAITQSDGSFLIENVVPGEYLVRQTPAPGWVQTLPTENGGVPVSVDSDETVEGVVFANIPRSDYGDAPEVYRTLSSQDGPVHGYTPGFYLGSLVDGEGNGTPSPTADGDDLSGSNDDDGVQFLSGLQAGQSAEIIVRAQQLSVSPGYLQAWIDFNGDGDWNDAGEQIFKNQRLSTGVNRLSFPVPADATLNPTFARFRWGFERNMGPTGPAMSGEVEDYRVTIPMSPDSGVRANDDTFTVAEDSRNNALAVLANDQTLFASSLTITSVGPTDKGGTVSIDGNVIRYSPAANFAGTETFSYSIRDDLGGVDTATVTVTVTERNDDPNAVNDTFTVSTNSVDTVLDVLANDTITPDVGETLIITEVGTTSAGGTVVLDSGGQNLVYTPAANFSGTETFTYKISDGRGGESMASVTVTVQDVPDLVEFELRVTNQSGTPITSVQTGDTFLLQVFVEDLRDVPLGVMAAHLDMLYTSSLVSVSGPIEFNDAAFPSAQRGSTAIAGLVDEAGALTSVRPTTPGPLRLLSVPFRADAVGTVSFAADPADVLPRDETTLFGLSTAVPMSQIIFGQATLTITGSGAMDDSFSVAEDSVNHLLDVLANDLPTGGVALASVGQPSQGGSAQIVNNQIRYSPAPNFFGTETFSYTVTGTGAGANQATVTMTVTNVNDNPTAVDDGFAVNANTLNNVLNVLANDSSAPDPTEVLTVVSVTQGTNGGTVAISADSRSVRYTPAVSFTGTDTFSYTISDGNGGFDQAVVTVTVNPAQANKLVDFDFEITTPQGQPVTILNLNDPFVFIVRARDLRDNPRVVFSAYLDVIYEGTGLTPGEVQITGPIDFNELVYPSSQKGTTTTVGLIDEVGAIDGISSTPAPTGAELFRVPMRATRAGVVSFTGNPADVLPANEVVLFGGSGPVPAEQQQFDSIPLTILGPTGAFTNISNPLDVNGDGSVSPMDAMLIIADMDSYGARRLPQGLAAFPIDNASSTSALAIPRGMVDVNRDGFITPIDAMLVINELDLRAAAATGTAIAAPLLATATPIAPWESWYVSDEANSMIDNVMEEPSSDDRDSSHDSAMAASRNGNLPWLVVSRFAIDPTRGIAGTTLERDESEDASPQDLEHILGELAEDVWQAWLDEPA